MLYQYIVANIWLYIFPNRHLWYRSQIFKEDFFFNICNICSKVYFSCNVALDIKTSPLPWAVSGHLQKVAQRDANGEKANSQAESSNLWKCEGKIWKHSFLSYFCLHDIVIFNHWKYHQRFEIFLMYIWIWWHPLGNCLQYHLHSRCSVTWGVENEKLKMAILDVWNEMGFSRNLKK